MPEYLVKGLGGEGSLDVVDNNELRGMVKNGLVNSELEIHQLGKKVNVDLTDKVIVSLELENGKRPIIREEVVSDDMDL